MLLAVGIALSACTTGAVIGPRASGGSGWARAGHPTYKVGAPYQINGVWYYPKVDYGYEETGVASWYGEAFDKQLTANGEIFDLNEPTAAHRTLPLPSVVEVTNLKNGRAMQLRVNDRGPYAQNRIIDVSRRAAQLLGFERTGTTPVRVRILKDESVQVAEAAMRGNTGNVQLASVVAPAVVASNEPPAAPHLVRERPLAVAALTPAPPTGLYRQTAATEIIASQPRPNPPEPVRAAVATEAVGSEPRPDPPAEPRPEPRTGPAPHRSPWYSPIATAEAETLPPRRSTGDRLVAPTAASSVAGRIFVQAGAFSVPENAQRAQSRIAALGSVQVMPISARGVELYRVRVGPVGSAAEADRLVTRLIQNGYPDARVVD